MMAQVVARGKPDYQEYRRADLYFQPERNGRQHDLDFFDEKESLVIFDRLCVFHEDF